VRIMKEVVWVPWGHPRRFGVTRATADLAWIVFRASAAARGHLLDDSRRRPATKDCLCQAAHFLRPHDASRALDTTDTALKSWLNRAWLLFWGVKSAPKPLKKAPPPPVKQPRTTAFCEEGEVKQPRLEVVMRNGKAVVEKYLGPSPTPSSRNVQRTFSLSAFRGFLTPSDRSNADEETVAGSFSLCVYQQRGKTLSP
jgi:hypothetical protein